MTFFVASAIRILKRLCSIIGIARKNFTYKRIRNMRPKQMAIVFKLYTTPSETQPIIQADDGVEAKKIQNIYVYCQCIVRIE